MCVRCRLALHLLPEVVTPVHTLLTTETQSSYCTPNQNGAQSAALG